MVNQIRKIALFLILMFAWSVGRTYAQAGCPGGSGGAITITNFKAKDTLGYDLAIVKGTLPTDTREVTLTSGGVSGNWPVGEGTFKAMVRLKPGPNPVVVSAVNAKNACIELDYAPNNSAKKLRLVLALPRDYKQGEPVIKSYPGEPNDLESTKKRLVMMALLDQTLYGELTFKAGLPRRAPEFKRDAQGDPEVLVVIADYAKSDTAMALGKKFDLILEKLKPYADPGTRFVIFNTINIGTASFASKGNHIFPIENELFAFPQSLSEVVARFNDRRTRADLHFKGFEKNTTTLGDLFKFQFGYWFKTSGIGNLEIPARPDSTVYDPFSNAPANLYTLIQSRDALGALIKSEMYLSVPTINAVKVNTWLVGSGKALPAVSAALLPKSLAQGLRYQYYEGPFDLQTQFASYGSLLSGYSTDFNFSSRKVEKNYAFVFSSYVKFDRTAPFHFEGVAKGACRLAIDDQNIFNKSRAEARAFGDVVLEAGYHRVQVAYIPDSGQTALSLYWSSPGVVLKAIPAAAYLRENPVTSVSARGIALSAVRLTPGLYQLDLPASERVSLRLVSPQGKDLGTLFTGELPAGRHRFVVPARAGNVFVRLTR